MRRGGAYQWTGQSGTEWSPFLLKLVKDQSNSFKATHKQTNATTFFCALFQCLFTRSDDIGSRQVMRGCSMFSRLTSVTDSRCHQFSNAKPFISFTLYFTSSFLHTLHTSIDVGNFRHGWHQACVCFLLWDSHLVSCGLFPIIWAYNLLRGWLLFFVEESNFQFFNHVHLPE